MSVRAFVIAHYDPAGSLRTDLLELIQKLGCISKTIVFVSTGLNEASAALLEGLCSVIIRPNTGYDFYSYKVGIEAVGDLAKYDELVIMNSSFLCLDTDLLIKRFLDAPRSPGQLIGLTESSEYSLHLQSFFITFPKEVITSPYFREWWDKVEPINSRSEVISRYELGISSFFTEHGFTLNAIFKPSPEQQQIAHQRFEHLYHRTPDESVTNPTQFTWDFLLAELGIIKIELLTKNPHGIQLKAFYKSYETSHKALIRMVRKSRTRKDTLREVKRTILKIARK